MENQSEQKTCETCRHFRQHYVHYAKQYHPIDQGHCTDPRIREKTIKTPACHRWSKRG